MKFFWGNALFEVVLVNQVLPGSLGAYTTTAMTPGLQWEPIMEHDISGNAEILSG